MGRHELFVCIEEALDDDIIIALMNYYQGQSKLNISLHTSFSSLTSGKENRVMKYDLKTPCFVRECPRFVRERRVTSASQGRRSVSSGAVSQSNLPTMEDEAD